MEARDTEATIKAYYLIEDCQSVANRLGITPQEVSAIANKLGLRKRPFRHRHRSSKVHNERQYKLYLTNNEQRDKRI